ncbi:MAG: acyltransferase [Bacteroidia bacterium]|nr:acyltransferase [Bacteroidia bacterium]
MGKLKILLLHLINKLADFDFLIRPNQSRFKIREFYLKKYKFTFHSASIRLGINVYFKQKGNISFGRRCCIGSFSQFWNYDKITIGDDFLSAGNLIINTGSHELHDLSPYSKKVTIGNRVWCGTNVTILCGVTIGDDVVVAAGSVVTKNVENGTVVGGVPAKFIKRIENRTKVIKQFEWLD